MNVRCPQCETTFRVDPERIPATGIKARCSRCSTVFELTRQGAMPARPAAAQAAPPKLSVSAPASAPAAAPAAPTPAAAAPTPAPAPAPAPRPAATTAVEDPAAGTVVPRPLPPRDMPPPITPAATPAQPAATSAPAAATEPAPVKRPSFRNQDPGARAQRLARALVSDIVAYNKDRVQQASSPAALRTEFRDEIRKSWEEYVEQVGLDLAKSTPYFRDALNEILARGEKVF